jgi:hypothetical protein
MAEYAGTVSPLNDFPPPCGSLFRTNRGFATFLPGVSLPDTFLPSSQRYGRRQE